MPGLVESIKATLDIVTRLGFTKIYNHPVISFIGLLNKRLHVGDELLAPLTRLPRISLWF